MAVNEKYSHKSFKRQDLTKLDASEFNDSEIIHGMFCQEKPWTDVFPPDIKGVVFDRCNLDNCNIPSGATVIGGTNKHWKDMADGEQWQIDKDEKPIAPMNPKAFDAQGVSKNPADIIPMLNNVRRTEAKRREYQEKIEQASSRDTILTALKAAGELPANYKG
jgi:hypothetical protein